MVNFSIKSMVIIACLLILATMVGINVSSLTKGKTSSNFGAALTSMEESSSSIKDLASELKAP